MKIMYNFELLQRRGEFMGLNKFFISSSLAIALIIAFAIPNEALAVENNALETDFQVKQLSEQEIQQLALELNAVYANENLGAGTENPVFETRGVKSKAVLKVAEMLVKSGNKTVNILEDINLLDTAAAKSFKKVTGKVGNFVESLASAGDDAAAMAKSQLPKKLESWGIRNKGTQKMIANAVSYAIKAADWLFL